MIREIAKQLGLRLGGFRVFSYGSLYPALRAARLDPVEGLSRE